MKIDVAALTGMSSAHVVPVADFGMLQAEAAEALMAMRSAAASAGFDLKAVSCWRDFARQRRIWNAKCRLERPLLDAQGAVIDGHALEPRARIEAILRWSAIPGASRHHWGTDCDVYDRAALADPAALRLVPEEYAPGGPCAPLHAWLQRHMHDYGFYQPYRTDRGGVCPEPWHLSYAPLAKDCERRLDCSVLQDLLDVTSKNAELRLEGNEILQEYLPSWYARFIAAVDPPPPVLQAAY